jgi:NADP-dependent 3-hydroxy acid dehydrogenase YdfG
MKRLDGKVAVVTEAVGSVGLATARKFVDEGARVFITGRDKVRMKPRNPPTTHHSPLTAYFLTTAPRWRRL